MNEFLRRAQAHDTRIAFRAGSGETSYRELVRRSAAIASRLLDGAHDLAGERIAFTAPAGVEYAALQWGIWRAGAIAVPLDHAATTPELQHVLQTAGVRRVLCARAPVAALVDAAAGSAARCFVLDMTADVGARSFPDIDPARRAMIVFTSGTTSKPKGVVTTHGMIRAQIETLVSAWEWQAGDCIPLFLPLHHVHGIINVLGCALWSGACVEPFDGFAQERILQRVREHAYSVFMAVPTIYVRLIQRSRPWTKRSGRQLRGIWPHAPDGFGLGGAAREYPARWQQLTGQRLLERYGMTEIGMALSNPLHGERRPGSVGLPLPGVDVRLVSERGEPIAGEELPGEIQVRGPGVFAEYWDNPQASAQAFVDGWFRTGDVAVREQGYYRIMGRQSVDIIKSAGYKLSALEIENVLLAHPKIAECAVFGLDDPTWGEVVAVVAVLRANATLELEELQRWCTERLSAYKQPRRLRTLGALPRNAMGKVLKPGLRELFRSDA